MVDEPQRYSIDGHGATVTADSRSITWRGETYVREADVREQIAQAIEARIQIPMLETTREAYEDSAAVARGQA